MSDFLELLFMNYVSCPPEIRQRSEEAEKCFQRLASLVGKDEAIDIWDTIRGEGSEEYDWCFRSGLKLGLTMAAELRDLLV